jgi:hypothetical protein
MSSPPISAVRPCGVARREGGLGCGRREKEGKTRCCDGRRDWAEHCDGEDVRTGVVTIVTEVVEQDVDGGCFDYFSEGLASVGVPLHQTRKDCGALDLLV